ncbi:MAG TPA: cupin domain-containing protein [Streptosporangiaceae bacterium]|jgi:quercetin dioxygenase-like cupin family protein
MQSQQDLRTILYRIAEEAQGPAVDVLGPTIEFITQPAQDDSALCVLRGIVPPGVTVPMHSHEDAEDFYILAGTQEVLTQHPEGLEWAHAHAGDYVRVPPGTMHAHRNVSSQPAVDLIITTARVGRFFQEIGAPVTGQPPSPQHVARFVETAIRYGYTLATPEQNAAAGIELPKFPG